VIELSGSVKSFVCHKHTIWQNNLLRTDLRDPIAKDFGGVRSSKFEGAVVHDKVMFAASADLFVASGVDGVVRHEMDKAELVGNSGKVDDCPFDK
jgi:hypothetical protein